MSPQQRANELLAIWQLQRIAGIPADNRRLPANDRDSFERDLETVRQCMERV